MLPFELGYTDMALDQRTELKTNPALKKRYKAVQKAIEYLKQNPRHPSLNTHEYPPMTKEMGVKVFEAYAENNTPGAYRIFWHYGSESRQIIILSITPHP